MASSSSSEVPDAEAVAFECFRCPTNHHLVGKYRKINQSLDSIRYVNGSNPKVFATRTNGGWEFVHESRMRNKILLFVICRSVASSAEGALMSFDPSLVTEWIDLEAEPFTVEFALHESSESDSESAADRSKSPATPPTPPTAQPRRKKQKQIRRYCEETPLMPWLPENGWRIPGVQQMPLAQVKVHN